MPSPRRKPVGVRDLLELPTSGADAPWAYVKVAEGLRPRVRVLRDPVIPRQAALAHARSRSKPKCARWWRAASRRSCSSRRTSRGTAATSASPARSSRCCAASTSCAPHGLERASAAVPLPVGSARPARVDDARAADGRSVLRSVAAARGAALLRRMKRWGSGEQFLDHRAHPRRGARGRVPLDLHSGIPRRAGGGSRRTARVPRRSRAARLGGFLRVLAGRRHCGGHHGR